MLNQVVVVGRIVDIFDNQIVMNIPRSYKNEHGEYDTDTIPVKLTGNIFNNVKEYCKAGDLVGIKGVLESEGITIVVRGDKVTFLSSTKEGGE